MYLIHNTKLNFLKNIILDDKLKSSYLTNNINEGKGIYKSKDQKFIFFSVIDSFESKYNIIGDIILFFDSKLLWNRSYYISTKHSPNPSDLDSWNDGKDYKKKYKQYYKSTNDVLNKLFKNSISMLKKGFAFQVFQQIAINKECNLKYLLKIKFLKNKPNNSIIKLINIKYPNVILDF